jgi:CheY-like chemotaxis protein
LRILVAEDEEDTASVYCSILVSRGHEVILTSNGEECLNVYRQKLQERQQRYHNEKVSSSYFDIVILDYRMPRKHGLQAAKEILEANPEQRIIFASAYVMPTVVESVKELKRVVELMQKPFSMSALINTVENTEAYEGLKRLIATTRDIIKDFDNPSSDQIRELFDGLKRCSSLRDFSNES